VRLSAYRNFHKAVQRARLLYEATVHSYNALYESGRDAIRRSAAENATIEFKLGAEVVRRPLKIVTYHARDVYPELLRSILLVNLVAAYEAFLVETVQEISSRSRKPFMNETRFEMSQEQLLSIDSDEGIFAHVVRRTLRRLTGSGLKEIRRFYQKAFGCDLVPPGQPFDIVEEIHDRRHLFVHRSGYVDKEYEDKYPVDGIVEEQKIPVPETYLIGAMRTLDASAMHVKVSVEALFPSAPVRKYIQGALQLPVDPPHLQYVCFRPLSETAELKFSDLALELGDDKSLRDVLVWMSTDGQLIRLLVGGTENDLKRLRLVLRRAEKNGDIRFVESFKVKRGDT
jgi:hypothetical protein